ncbi:ferrous iron transport protein B [Fibrella aestuarina BUZ 2]|uniref:Ferrous iron transport protein B n=1 Tax=Fibrella aestuarina BUZ 2 TaxID=1166018 RepID=I0K6Y7_9BACT|nr:ferrous iron transport protein B [Fibrella aestuarina]CCG99890.1 ferrous iron transport protein B [Fibrella aestuarina BUZ 2]
MKTSPVLALVGNPNAGKSSLFNQLTGLRQKTGNFPGVTMDKKSGVMSLTPQLDATVVDLPGVYSIYPKSLDEQIVTDILANPTHPDYPDVAVVVLDASNLRRNLLLFTQIMDLRVPTVLALNMLDVARQQQQEVNAVRLSMRLGIPVVRINARTGEGLELLRKAILQQLDEPVIAESLFFDPETDPVLAEGITSNVPDPVMPGSTLESLTRPDLIQAAPNLLDTDTDLPNQAGPGQTQVDPTKADQTWPSQARPGLIAETKQQYNLSNNYLALQYIIQHDGFTFLTKQQREGLDRLISKYEFSEPAFQVRETIRRYELIAGIITDAVTDSRPANQPTWSQRLDRVLLHPIWGYAIFGFILLLIFQVIFAWATPFMDAIDEGVAWLNGTLKDSLPAGPLTDLLTDGVLAGIGGILVFIPQIAFLFLLVSLLEESGYMSRVMVLMDRIMRKFGLNGRSVVPLISGVACAVPAIMATRAIGSRRDRLITILVTPLMSCSARLPIYTILIALVVPDRRVLGLFNLQGLALMSLYLLGLLSALAAAWVFKLVLKTKERSLFVMELPTFKAPRWNHVGLTVWESVRSFVFEAGRVILAISIILWVLASYGPGNSMDDAEARIRQQQQGQPEEQVANAVAAQRLEASYAGHFGHFIEPAIKPLGYDWKIGVALLASFAAREVFVGTMSTIYSLGAGDTGDDTTIRQRLKAERNADTGGPMYTPAVAWSLLVFYVFAMMCMSTIATTYRETKGWTWPLVQLGYMSVLAYVSAWATYLLLR